MKIWTQLKKDTKYFKASIAYFIFCFIVAPLVLGILYGMLYEKMLDKSIQFSQMNVYLVEKEEDHYIDVIQSMLSSKELTFIKITKVDNNDFDETVKKDKDSLGIREQNGEVFIINYGADSTEKIIVKNLVTQVIEILSTKGIYQMTSSEKNSFISEFMDLSRRDFTVMEETSIAKKLTSYQLMVVGTFTAMSLFIGITFASNFLKERENSMAKRLISININERGIYISNIISVYILSFITVCTYSVVAYGIVLKMQFAIMPMSIACLLQAGVIAALYGLSIGLFHREHVYKNSITPIVMVIMILGGSFFPIDMFQNVIAIAKIMPNYNILKLYEGILLGNGLAAVAKPIIILLIEIVVLIGVGALRFTIGERSKKYV